jgi:CRP/FNR family transcriptional regulator
MMGRQQAQEQLAIFLNNLTTRYQRLQRNGSVLTLPMSRYDIANYLGLVVETVSRLFSRMKDMGVIEVDPKSVRILRSDLLADLCGSNQVSAPKRRSSG